MSDSRKTSVLFLIVSVLALILVLLVKHNYNFVRVSGDSMYPTLKSGDVAVLLKQGDPSRNGIIIFNAPKAWLKIWTGEPHPRFIKRIQGLPGDKLDWDGSVWYINDVRISALKTGTCKVPNSSIIIPKDYFFVTGDRQNGPTLDSRESFCRNIDFLVPRENVVSFGKLIGNY